MGTAMTTVGGLPLELFAAQQRMARFPEKGDMILLTSARRNWKCRQGTSTS